VLVSGTIVDAAELVLSFLEGRPLVCTMLGDLDEHCEIIDDLLVPAHIIHIGVKWREVEVGIKHRLHRDILCKAQAAMLVHQKGMPWTMHFCRARVGRETRG
jgi:hypothetical protein